MVADLVFLVNTPFLVYNSVFGAWMFGKTGSLQAMVAPQ
jgi:hypothetical protein